MFKEQISYFFDSIGGQIVFAILISLILLIILGVLYKKQEISIKNLSFMSISIALAVLLSYVKISFFATGGSITACSMFFICIIGYIYGLFPGILAGITYGLLSFVLEPQFYHPMQVLLDYPFAFGLLGLSGLLVNKKYGLYIGYIVACLGRMIASTISGVIFFGSYAAAQGMNVWTYSIGYNASYIIPEMVITIIIISVPAIKNAINRIKQAA